ncbi:hypothetical protein IF2G_08529 [Cordyceps javanica]|nr:hypothetical protein IF2G_08529 [Cordyceps javanica]
MNAHRPRRLMVMNLGPNKPTDDGRGDGGPAQRAIRCSQVRYGGDQGVKIEIKVGPKVLVVPVFKCLSLLVFCRR